MDEDFEISPEFADEENHELILGGPMKEACKQNCFQGFLKEFTVFGIAMIQPPPLLPIDQCKMSYEL